jgi:hypothetical protein
VKRARAQDKGLLSRLGQRLALMPAESRDRGLRSPRAGGRSARRVDGHGAAASGSHNRRWWPSARPARWPGLRWVSAAVGGPCGPCSGAGSGGFGFLGMGNGCSPSPPAVPYAAARRLTRPATFRVMEDSPSSRKRVDITPTCCRGVVKDNVFSRNLVHLRHHGGRDPTAQVKTDEAPHPHVGTPDGVLQGGPQQAD